MPLINTHVQPFRAQAFQASEEDFFGVTEQTLLGQWSVLCFYPADFTFVCPTELADLAQHHEAFENLGVKIYGVSTDTVFAHKAWHESSAAIAQVRYPLIGDPAHVLARQFGVLIEDEGLALRGTFLIDPEGRVKLCEIHDNGIGRAASELLRKTQAAIHVANHPGEVCPANWHIGGDTLKPSLNLVGKI